jgi:hypothetical protein
MAGRGVDPAAAGRVSSVPATRDLHAPWSSVPLSSLDELGEMLGDTTDVTEVHFYFPVEIEVVQAAEAVDTELIIGTTLERLAQHLESRLG